MVMLLILQMTMTAMIKMLEMELMMMVIFTMKNITALKIIKMFTGIMVTELTMASYDNFKIK